MHRKINFFAFLLSIPLLLPLSNFAVLAAPKNDSNTVGDYIVVFKDTVSNPETVTEELSKKKEFEYEHVYKKALKGFSASLNKNKLAELKADPRVQFISEDQEVSAAVVSVTPSSLNTNTQSTPSGVMRVGKATETGSGIGVAILDTGIDFNHADLTANLAADSKSCIKSAKTANDDNGHGTHVAGTIAALNNTVGVVGVAPDVTLFAVKVLNSQGSGTWSSIICGIDWVTMNASKYGIKVVNMSLGGSGTSDNNCGKTNGDALHKAICRSRDAGVTYVVAAGNDGKNASGFVPAGYDDTVITVSALADTDGKSGGTGIASPYGDDDTFATFSNYGSVVDIAAPGVLINSTYKGNTYKVLSGTSMATPHVAAAAALYLKSHTGSSWTQIRDGLISIGESAGAGHTDPSGKHPEKVLRVTSL